MVGPVLDATGVAVTDCVVADFEGSVNGGDPAALNGSATYKWSVPNIVVTASATAGSSLQYAVIYNSLSALGGHMLAWCKLSTAAFNVTKGNTLTVTCPANGIFVIY